MGTGHDLTPPTQDTRERASRVPDLLRLRDLFTSRIPGTPARVVPDLIYHFADLLVRTAMLETAVPVIDSYARGIPIRPTTSSPRSTADCRRSPTGNRTTGPTTWKAWPPASGCGTRVSSRRSRCLNWPPNWASPQRTTARPRRSVNDIEKRG
ncbi:hypothetical protein ACFQQB_57810 [Nonomuraea rubra]|uniref:hypothetical protein n=1 Tax=Nonomuraea rubra TaxID=46180 RepID=UPI003605BD46